ncbi:MAG: hypothetical protein WED09_09430 [Homoserinimonas sp.]
MPTDAELRTLFRDAPTPASSIDAAAIIRRSKRRRLPQQVGAGSVLTLAVAGIGVASFNGLQGLTPSMTAADAPVGVAESGPFSESDEADGSMAEQRSSCDSAALGETGLEAEVPAGLDLSSHFPTIASTGEAVAATLTLTNTSAEPMNGVVLEQMVVLARGGSLLSHRDQSAAQVPLNLAPGESMTLDFSFDAVDCDGNGRETGAPLMRGEYDARAVLQLRLDDGPVTLLRGPVSVIMVR